MASEEVPFIGRKEQMDTFLAMISTGRGNCLMVYGGPGIGKSRLLAEFEREALQERFNVISFSVSELFDELSFFYQLGNGLQNLLVGRNKQSQLYQFLSHRTTKKGKEIEKVTLGVASAAAGVVSVPVGLGLSAISIFKTLKDSFVQDDRKMVFLADTILLLFQDLNELVKQNQKLVIFLDDCHKFRDSEVFQALIGLFLGGIPENAYLVIASRRRFPEIKAGEIEILGFSENELEQVVEKAFAGADVDTLKEASGGHPYIIDRLFRMKAIPEFSIRDMGIEAIMDYVDTEFIQSLSKDELEFLMQISPIEEITYESAEAVTQKPHIFVRKLMQELISRFLLCFTGRRDSVSHEKIYKIHEVFRPTLQRSLSNLGEIHGILADFYSLKMKKTVLRSNEAYYLRLCLIHLRQSCVEEYISLVMEKAEEGEILDVLGRYKEALELIDDAIELCEDSRTRSFLEAYEGHYLKVLGRIDDAKRLCQKAISQFTEIGDEKGLALSLYEMGDFLEMEGQNDFAQEHFEKSIDISKSMGDAKIHGRNLHKMSIICYDKCEYKKALDYIDESINLCRRASNIEGEIDSMIIRSLVLEQTGSWDEATIAARSALEISRSSEYAEGEGSALDQLASIEYDRGNYSESFKYARLGEEIYQRIGDLLGLGYAVISQVRIIQKWGRYTEALSQSERALMIARTVQNVWAESGALHYAGTSYLGTGDYEKANEYLKESFNISERMKDLSGMGATLHWMGVLSFQKGNFDDAIGKLKKAAKISKDLGEKAGLVDSLYWVGKAYEKRGARDKALKIFQKSLRSYRRIGDRKGIADSILMIGVVHRKAGHHISSSRKIRIALEIYRKMSCEPDIAEAMLEFARTKKEMKEEAETRELLLQAAELAKKLRIPKLEVEICQEICNLQDTRTTLTSAIVHFLKQRISMKQEN
jgi:tetratricopeptide (TPR) repeat protein